jgi:hypothetical protein
LLDLNTGLTLWGEAGDSEFRVIPGVRLGLHSFNFTTSVGGSIESIEPVLPEYVTRRAGILAGARLQYRNYWDQCENKGSCGGFSFNFDFFRPTDPLRDPALRNRIGVGVELYVPF